MSESRHQLRTPARANPWLWQSSGVVPVLKIPVVFCRALREILATPSPFSYAPIPNQDTTTLTPATLLTTHPKRASAHRPSSSSSSASSASSSASSVFSTHSPPPSTASSTTTSLGDPDETTLSLLTAPTDRHAALDLIAESIRQQRATAVRAIVYHPVSILAFLTALLLSWIFSAGNRPLRDALFGTIVTASILLTSLVSGQYFLLAEGLGKGFLRGPYGSASEDLVLGARSDQTGELVGALVLRVVQPNHAGSGRRRGRATGRSTSGGQGLIRAWTTRAENRRRGIGADMLYEAVRLTKERCGRDAAVGFAAEHANGTMVLPDMFNGPFRAVERMAATKLRGAKAEWEANKKRRRV